MGKMKIQQMAIVTPFFEAACLIARRTGGEAGDGPRGNPSSPPLLSSPLSTRNPPRKASSRPAPAFPFAPLPALLSLCAGN